MSLLSTETLLYDNQREEPRIQVVETPERRELRFGNDITQSARSHRTPELLALDYTRAMMAGLLFLPDAATVLHVGLGAGSIPSFIHRNFSSVRQHVVELSGEVIQVAYRYFDLPRSRRITVVCADGAEFLRTCTERFDLIFLDAFHAEGVPPHLAAPTFLSQARAHLNNGGWLVSNAWGSDRALLRKTVQKLGEQFADLYAISVRVHSNVILIGGNPTRGLSMDLLRRRARALEDLVPLEFTHWAERIRPGRMAPE
jgi:spermidine synthase